MKNGTYLVSFQVRIQDCLIQEDAQKDIISLLVDSIEGEVEFPEVNFELVEEEEPEYHTEEDSGVEELQFEEAI